MKEGCKGFLRRFEKMRRLSFNEEFKVSLLRADSSLVYVVHSAFFSSSSAALWEAEIDSVSVAEEPVMSFFFLRGPRLRFFLSFLLSFSRDDDSPDSRESSFGF